MQGARERVIYVIRGWVTKPGLLAAGAIYIVLARASHFSAGDPTLVKKRRRETGIPGPRPTASAASTRVFDQSYIYLFRVGKQSG